VIERYDGIYTDVKIHREAELTGTATGEVHVHTGSRVQVMGTIHHLRIERAGTAVILGTVLGDVHTWGRLDVEDTGVIEGHVVMHAGRISGVPTKQVVSPPLEPEVLAAAGRLAAAQRRNRQPPWRTICLLLDRARVR